MILGQWEELCLPPLRKDWNQCSHFLQKLKALPLAHETTGPSTLIQIINGHIVTLLPCVWDIQQYTRWTEQDANFRLSQSSRTNCLEYSHTHTSAINSLWKCLSILSNSCYSLSITRMLYMLIPAPFGCYRNWVPSTSFISEETGTENQQLSQGSRELSSESTALCSPLLVINTLYPPIKSLLEYWFFILSTSFSMIHFLLGKQCLEGPDTLFSMKWFMLNNLPPPGICNIFKNKWCDPGRVWCLV